MHGAIPAPPRPAADAASPTREMLIDVGNMLKAFIGLNFMYVAYAFSKAGLVRACIGLLVITFLTEHCCILLVQVKNAMPGQSTPDTTRAAGYAPVSAEDDEESPAEEPHLDGKELAEEASTGDAASSAEPAASDSNPPQYGDIAYFVGGRPAQNIVNAALVLTQFGYCVGYLIFLSQTVHHMLPEPTQHAIHSPWLVLLPIPVLAALAMLASIRSLGPFSIIANAALLFGFVSVVVFIGRHYHWNPSYPPLSDFPLFFGSMTAALEGIGLVIPVETSMRNRDKFPLVLRIALSVLTTVLMVVGALGFATFGEDTRSILVQNFGKSPVVALVKSVLLVGILFTYPLQIIPVFQFAERILCGDRAPTSDRELDVMEGDAPVVDESTSETEPALPENCSGESLFVQDRRRIALRLAIVVSTAMVAMMAGRSFGLVQSLVGSLGASCLAYTAPAFFHLVTFRDQLGVAGKAKNIGIVVFGVVGAVVGTATTIMAFGKDEVAL